MDNGISKRASDKKKVAKPDLGRPGSIDPLIPWSEDYRHAVLPDGCLRRLQMTLDHWRTQYGFAVVALPWMVPEKFMAATRPDFVDPTIPDLGTEEGPLVCSAEQAFLWLHAQKALPPAPGYIGWTPCFRRELYAPGRHHYFLKAELFVLAPTDTGGGEDRSTKPNVQADDPVVEDKSDEIRDRLACNTMRWWGQLAALEQCPRALLQLESPDDDGVVDISGLIKGQGFLELGSFGVRTCPSETQRYIFGTALAEPRWSIVHSQG